MAERKLMNYILIANVKDKIIENKYLEQFKGYMKVYDTGNAYILKLKNSNLKFESILCKMSFGFSSKDFFNFKLILHTF